MANKPTLHPFFFLSIILWKTLLLVCGCQMSSHAADEINGLSTAVVPRASKRRRIRHLTLWFMAMVGKLRLPTRKLSDRVTLVGIFFTQKGSGKLNVKWHAHYQTHSARGPHIRRTSTSRQRSGPGSCGSSIPKYSTLICAYFPHRRITSDANERAK